MTDVKEPCGNDECDKCNPLPRWKVSVERVARIRNEREFKAATPEEALAEYNQGTAWPTSYDDNQIETLELHEPVVTPVVHEDWLREMRLETYCYHNLPKLPEVAKFVNRVGLTSCDFCGGGCVDENCEKCWPKESPVHPKIEEAFQQIDAALYNGDVFDKPDNRKKLKEYAQAWLRRIEEDEAHEQQDQSASQEDEADGDRPSLREQEPGSGE